MSNSDTDELPNTGWFDSESDLPEISSVDPTIELGVNMSSPSASMTLARALKIEDSNKTGPAPNTVIPVGYIPMGGNGPIKGESFFRYPNSYSPQNKSPSPVPFHREWSMGRGRGVRREGQKSSTLPPHIQTSKHSCCLTFLSRYNSVTGTSNLPYCHAMIKLILNATLITIPKSFRIFFNFETIYKVTIIFKPCLLNLHMRYTCITCILA